MFDLSTEDLRGIWVPLVLPVGRRGGLPDLLAGHLEPLADAGVSGLFIDTSSCASVDAEELLAAAAAPAAELELPVLVDSDRVPMVRAEELGASASLVHLSPGDLTGYLHVASESGTTPIVIDGRGSGDWSPDQLREAHGAAPLLGYIHGGSEGEALDGLGAVRDLIGILAPPTIGHTAWRWGAHGLAGELLLLDPGWFERAWAGIEEGERGLSELELRLQRFEELALQPLRRRSSDPAVVASLLAAVNDPERWRHELDGDLLEATASLAEELLPELGTSG